MKQEIIFTLKKASHHSSLKFNEKLVKFKGFEEPQKVWRVTYPGMSKLDTEKRVAAMKARLVKSS